MEKHDITVGIVGAGGDGVIKVGDIIAHAAASAGLHCMMIKSFGPQIRGGETSCRVRMSEDKVHSPGNGLDILACLSWEDYPKFKSELALEDNVIILMDEHEKIPDSELPIKIEGGKSLIKIPFTQISRDIKNPRGKNMVMLGALAELFSFPQKELRDSICKIFGSKKPEIVEANLQAFQSGADYVKENISEKTLTFEFNHNKKRLILTGNEAVAYGALVAGCRFFSSYPITPASEIMVWLSKELPKFGGTVVQAEDEISAICMITGAAYGGIKSMTATSGPGLSLKQEALGLGSMAELPYVIVNVQRGGPSTGMPTKSEQSDLFQSIYGTHGDAPHAVMAATDVEDCFRATIEAFNIAETYQMPVVLLSDQFVGHRTETVRDLDYKSVKILDRLAEAKPKLGSYNRFLDTEDGISPTTWPGIPEGQYLCSGIEHDETGAPSANYDIHEKMSAKRAKKLLKLEKEFSFIRNYGEKTPEVGIISWGSNKGVVREAVEHFEAQGKSVGGIIPQLLYPLQKDKLNAFLENVKTLIVVENSFSGQFLSYLRGELKLPNVFHLKAAGGRAFTVQEVVDLAEMAINNN
jgi:2-oxoglutarate ferredoxin oxidoreductase subunit alpha